MPPLHAHAQLRSECHEAVVGDAGQDGRGVRSDIGDEVAVAADAEEVRRAALVDIALLLGVQEDAAESLPVCGLGGTEGGGVVAPDFPLPGAEWRRAVHVTVDDEGCAVEADGIVRPDGGRYDGEEEISRRADAQSRGDADEQRPEIECGAGLVRREPVTVMLIGQKDAAAEEFDGHRGHAECFGAARHAPRVLLHTEDTHPAVRSAEGLESFEGLLPVLQACGTQVHLHRLVGRHDRFGPCTVVILTADDSVRLGVVKAQGFPIYIHSEIQDSIFKIQYYILC